MRESPIAHIVALDNEKPLLTRGEHSFVWSCGFSMLFPFPLLTYPLYHARGSSGNAQTSGYVNTPRQISTIFSQIKKPNWCSVLALVNFRGRAVATPLPCPAPSRADITACLPLRPVILSRVPWYRLTIIIMVCGNRAIDERSSSQTHHNYVRTILSPFKTLERFTSRGIAG